jgi:hypothetical protein
MSIAESSTVMRTTVRLDDALLRRAKQHAAERGMTLTSVLREALESYLARPVHSREAFDLPASGEGGVLPGVDLARSSLIYEIMEGRHDPV